MNVTSTASLASIRSRPRQAGACALGNCKQTLAERRAVNSPFDRVNQREDGSIEKKYFRRFKMALFQQAEIQPPGEVADEIKIRESRNLEAGLLQQMPQIGTPVATEMAKIFIDWGIYFGASRDEKAQIPLSPAEHAGVKFEFGFVLLYMLEHIHAKDRVPVQIWRQVFGSTLDQVVAGKL
jgi:hypothetical protein